MSPHRIHRLLVFCASAALLAFATPSHATDRFWSNSAGGSFNVPGNWQLGLVPGAADNANFGLGNFTYPVTFPTDVSNNQLTLNRNNVTFDLLTHQYQLTAVGSDIATAAIRVGTQVGDNAFLRVTNGTLAGNTTLVGWLNGSEDNLFISTGGILNSANLDIGHFGIGHLTIDSAGIVNSANAINLGTNGTGNLNIYGGGRLTTNGQAHIGVSAPAVGDVTVDGTGSNWTTNSLLVVGDAGKGIVTIDNGASISAAADGLIGSAAGSTGSVTVDGASGTDASTMTIGGNLDVGTFGTAFLSITNQASVSSHDSFVGRNAGGKGTVKITDNFADWRCTNLYVAGDASGPGGTGLVNIANNGLLNVTGPITVWPSGTLQSYPVSISTAELRLRGGKFSAWSNFNAPISNGGGTIEVPGSNILFLNNTLTSLPGSLLQRMGTGDLYISGPQNHAPNSTFQAMGGQTYFRSNAGTPASAASPATANLNILVGPQAAKITLLSNQVLHQLTVSTSNAGRQSFDLNSATAPGAFASVSVYTPATKPDLWAAIVNANRSGASDPQDGIFDSGLASHPNSRIGIAKLTDLHGDSYLLVRPTRIGDVNLDGMVTISDFIDLSAHFNASGPNVTWQEGDVNYDNAVTVADFIDLAANFGSSYAGASAHFSSVPEPSTFILLLSSAMLILSHPGNRARGR
ncbi:MAG TPA: hypothetical protein VGP94_12210 [Tepidisphaeraceae bacterium]|nr:hypothetical protein [Tepidisphaeraceae bacterium]